MEPFEKKMARLEEIVERLEERDIPLGEALALFEEGVVLVREVDTILHGAEGKIRELMDDLRLRDMDAERSEESD